MSDKQIVLIDFSSIAHPVWHMAANDPNPNATSIGIIAKVHALASGQPHVALCLDSRKSFRKALDATYKASRESKPEPFFHQCQIALETLRADGFPTWEAEGFEADDVVASGVEAAKVGNWPVLVVSSDKDLLQLVDDRVSVKSPITGNVMTEEAVCEKFGVNPNQIMDYLAIVGDASDGIVGVKGIGAKGAAAILKIFGNLDDLYAAIDKGAEEGIKPAQSASLLAFRERLPIVRQLLALRTDAPIDFAHVLKERTPDDVATFSGEDDIMSDINEAMPTIDPKTDAIFDRIDRSVGGARELTGAQASDALGSFVAHAAKHMEAPPKDMGTFVADVARRVAHQNPAPKATPIPAVVESARTAVDRSGDTPVALASTEEAKIAAYYRAEGVDYERQLEPQSMNQAVQLAGLLFKARLFGAYGTPEAVLSTVLSGRELGLSAMASLRAFHIVEGRPTLAADALRALVIKSGKAKSFRCTERTPTAATFVTQREGDEPMELRYTIEEAHAAGLVKNGSGWTKNPADMLVARASSKLARLVYPDVVAGLYAPEEF
jgi:5'-3' exonuclease